MTLVPTKEMGVAALALVAALLTMQGRLAMPVRPAPVPDVPPVEAPAAVQKDELGILRPRLLTDRRATEGRNPFAVSDMWEDARPVAIPLPSDLPETRVVPVVSVAGGKVRAPRPPRIAALPAPEKSTGGAGKAQPSPSKVGGN